MVMGWVGRDPEAQYTPGGSLFCKFTIGSTRKWRDTDGQPKQETEWSNIICWNGLAEACTQYVTKGRLVYIEGYLRTDRWEADGIQQRRTFIVATDVKFIPTSRPGEHRRAFEEESLPADLGQPVEAQAQPAPTPAPKRNGRRKLSIPEA